MNNILVVKSLTHTRLLISTADCSSKAGGELRLTTSRKMGLLGVFLGGLA